MAASSEEEEETLEAALAGIPRVAEAISAMPVEDMAKALEAAEHSYYQTALDLGYGEAQAKGWAATIMVRLLEELEERRSPT